MLIHYRHYVGSKGEFLEFDVNGTAKLTLAGSTLTSFSVIGAEFDRHLIRGGRVSRSWWVRTLERTKRKFRAAVRRVHRLAHDEKTRSDFLTQNGAEFDEASGAGDVRGAISDVHRQLLQSLEEIRKTSSDDVRQWLSYDWVQSLVKPVARLRGRAAFLAKLGIDGRDLVRFFRRFDQALLHVLRLPEWADFRRRDGESGFRERFIMISLEVVPSSPDDRADLLRCRPGDCVFRAASTSG